MNEQAILETEYWLVFLHKDQANLGRLIVRAKSRDRTRLPDLTGAEWTDLITQVIPVCEDAIRKAFGATLFNWSCLMNLAYQNDPPDPHVHWHLRPRYRNAVEFAGETFTDEEFGKHYDPTKTRVPSDSVRQSIWNKIRESL